MISMSTAVIVPVGTVAVIANGNVGTTVPAVIVADELALVVLP